MPSPDLLDFAAVLAPISDHQPTGSNPRSTPGFDAAKRAVDGAITQERREMNAGEGVTPPRKVWGPVVTAATDLLCRQAKDIEVALWLAQGLVRLHGLPGLRDSLRLLRELTEHHWPALHPLPGHDQDEEDIANGEPPEDDRLRFLEGLQTPNTMLPILRLAPITDRKGSGTFSYADYLAASQKQLREATEAEGRRLKDQIAAAALEAGAAFYQHLRDDLALCETHLDGLENALMAQAATSGLTLGKLRDLLADIIAAVREISRPLIPDQLPAAGPDAGPDGALPAATGMASGFCPSGRNAAQDREAALRALADIAAFFKATEPHSPIGYTLDTLITRARMSLPELLEDLIPDYSTRESLLTTAGIRLPTSR